MDHSGGNGNHLAPDLKSSVATLQQEDVARDLFFQIRLSEGFFLMKGCNVFLSPRDTERF